jgi:Rv0623-like transcription factor
MAQRSKPQLNIRSSEARRRVAELARETGKSATQIVEDAVRAYRPQPTADRPIPEGMELVGRFLVTKPRGGSKITLEDTNRAIDADRNRGLWPD